LRAFELLGVDAVISMRSVSKDPGGKDWELATRAGSAVLTVTTPPPKSPSATAIADWLHRAIGYDAIVIDRRDNFMLVTGARESLTKKKPRSGASGLVSLDDNPRPDYSGCWNC